MSNYFHFSTLGPNDPDTHYAGGKRTAYLPLCEIPTEARRKGLSVPATSFRGITAVLVLCPHVCLSSCCRWHVHRSDNCSLSFLLWNNLCSLYPTASSVLSFCCSHCYYAICVFVLGFEQLAVRASSIFPRETTAGPLKSHVVPSFQKASNGCQRKSYPTRTNLETRAIGTFFL